LCSKHYAYKIKLLKEISIFQRLLAQVILFMKTNSTTLPDSLLVKQYIDGSELALENLINRHQARVFNFINSKVQDRDTAEDIFQDTFIKVIKTIKNGQYNEEGKFLPWIMRIAHNLVIDFFRKNNRMPKVRNTEEFDIFQFISDNSPNAEQSMVQDQVVKDLQKLVQELPDDQKEVLIMRLYRDMSFKEIAENTNVSINTALGRMRYAIINLRKLIEQNQIILNT
jgi:RNA polymerase sigma factor (sigma-70 family)